MSFQSRLNSSEKIFLSPTAFKAAGVDCRSFRRLRQHIPRLNHSVIFTEIFVWPELLTQPVSQSLRVFFTSLSFYRYKGPSSLGLSYNQCYKADVTVVTEKKQYELSFRKVTY